MKIYCMSCGEGVEFTIREPDVCPFCKDSLKLVPSVSTQKESKKPEIKISDINSLINRKKKKKEVEEEDLEEYEDEEEDLEEYDEEDDDDEEDLDDEDEDEPPKSRKKFSNKAEENPLTLSGIEFADPRNLREKVGSLANSKPEKTPQRSLEKLSKKEILRRYKEESKSERGK